MADAKITDLAQLNQIDFAADDAMPIVDDSAGQTKKTTVAQLDARYRAGTEIAYAEVTTNVTVSSSSATSPDDVITSGSATYDGSPVWIEFSAPALDISTDGKLWLVLWDGATRLGTVGLYYNLSAVPNGSFPAFCRTRITPSAGSHEYKIRAFRGSYNGIVVCGDGAAGNYVPMTLLVKCV